MSFLDYERPPTLAFRTPFDSVRFHVPQGAIQRFSEEGGSLARVILKPPPCGAFDPIIRSLSASLLPLLSGGRQSYSALYVDHVSMALMAHLLQNYSIGCVETSLVTGGLAPWQGKRARDALVADFSHDISIASLAKDCGLSGSHFARAFKQTFGLSPHRWRLQQQIALARSLLSKTDETVEAIAIACGFSGQSQFTRTFSRVTGAGPAAWRRNTLG